MSTPANPVPDGIELRKECTIEGCSGVLLARGWCCKHYNRWAKHGDPTFTLIAMGTPEARFWEHVDRRGPGECWPWKASISMGNGYSKFTYYVGGKQLTVSGHKFIYELIHGPVALGFQVDHVWARGCRLRHCVNPAHLEAVTAKENTRRAKALITHCPRGHPYDGPNLYLHPDGSRKCRACMRISQVAYQARKRADVVSASA